EGPRVPAVEDSPKRFKIGFIFLVRPGQVASDGELTDIDTIRDAFATRLVILSNGQAIAEAFADPTHAAPGTPPPVLPPSSRPRPAPASTSQAIAWLVGRQQTNGSFGDSTWTGPRDTAAAVGLLATIPSALTNRDRALAWLTTLGPAANVDTASR